MGGWSNDNRDRIFWDGWISQRNNPSLAIDLVTKGFADSTSGYVKKTGDNITGTLSFMTNNWIVGSYTELDIFAGNYFWIEALGDSTISSGTILQLVAGNELYLTCGSIILDGSIYTGGDSGLNITITTAKLTAGGTNGSMTFTNGILVGQTQAT